MRVGAGVGRALRWSRAGLLASVAVATSAAGHSVAGGHPPTPGVLVIMAALSTVVAGAMLGAPASRRRIVTVMFAGQAALHIAFTLASAHPSSGGLGGGNGHGRHLEPVPPPGATVEQILALHASGSPGWINHLGDAFSTDHGMVMLLAHLVATGLIGVWLGAGERLLWSLVRTMSVQLNGRRAAAAHRRRAVRLTLQRLRALRDADASALLSPDAGRPCRARVPILRQPVVRRGPPGVACA